MEQSSKNENKVRGNETCELFINEIIMEKQHAKESYHSLQITTRKNPRNEETMKINFQKLHAQIKTLENSSQKFLVLGFLFCK